LRTLPARSGTDPDSQSASLLAFRQHDDPNHRRLSSGSESSWTDTGDIGEQPADEHDPVRLQLPDELAADLEAARALEASPSSGASRAWALGLGLLGVAAVGGIARVVRRGARTRER